MHTFCPKCAPSTTKTAVILRADAGHTQPLAGPIYPSFREGGHIAARLTAGGSVLSRVMHAVGPRRDRAEGAHPPSYIRRQQLAPFLDGERWGDQARSGGEGMGSRFDWDWEKSVSLSELLDLSLSLSLVSGPPSYFHPRDRAYGGQIGISLTFEGLRRRGGSTPPKITTPCPRVSAPVFPLATSVPREKGGLFLFHLVGTERITPLSWFCF